MRRIVNAVSWALAALGAGGPLEAQSFFSEIPPAELRSGFGGAVAVADSDVLVGEPQMLMGPGVVHVYRKGPSGWASVARLSAPGATEADGFGSAITAGGSRMLVRSSAERGLVHVFERQEATWSEVARLSAGDGAPGDAFGAALALEGDVAVVGAPRQSDETGAAYVFRRDATGVWTQAAKLAGNEVGAGDQFGAAVGVFGDVVLVGAPGHLEFTGTVHAFRPSPSGWTEVGQLTPNGIPERSRYGATLSVTDGLVLVGAPAEATVGVLYVFAEAEGGLLESARLTAFDGARGANFGTSVARTGSELWVGAPGAAQSRGAAYRFAAGGPAGTFGTSEMLGLRDADGRDQFGGSLAAAEDVVVVGLSGDDSGEGSVVIYERTEQDMWMPSGKIFNDVPAFTAVTGAQVDCAANEASLFECDQVDLVSFLPIEALGAARGERTSEVWGWEDAETGHEYAIVGRSSGTSFVDITSAANPVLVGTLPKTPAAASTPWREMKTYKNHVFIVSDGAGPHGMQVFDMTRLREFRGEPITFTVDVLYDRIFSAHNIVINEETGFAYSVGGSGGGETCGGGSHMIDIRDPKNPTFAGCFAHTGTGRRGTGYTHDAQCVVYRGPDAEHRNKEICLASNETALSVADVTDKAAPQVLSMATYPTVGYTHQGWLTEDQRYFFMNDELDEINNEECAEANQCEAFAGTRTLIWDVTDLDDPQMVKEHFGTTRATDHNLFIRGNLMYQSNYQAGLRILDISDPLNPVEVGYFDTVPYGDNGPSMSGSWGNYPFFRSGAIVVGSRSEGLFVVKKRVPVS